MTHLQTAVYGSITKPFLLFKLQTSSPITVLNKWAAKLQGNAGVGNALTMLVCCAALALAPVLSAIGICERCQIQSGGVYFLVSHVLGGRIGGAVGVLYCFGQVWISDLGCHFDC